MPIATVFAATLLTACTTACSAPYFYAKRLDAVGIPIISSAKVDDAAMWRAIPLLRPLGLMARSPMVLGLLERAYIRFLRVRPRLQKLLR